MKNPTFLRLGTRERPFKQLNVGNKARLLNIAFKQGLPVPVGIVLLDEGWAQLQAEGVVIVEGDDVHVTHADRFLELFALQRLRRSVAVRSAFSAEDRADSALAGYFTTHLNVSPDDPDELIRRVIDVWRSAEKRPGSFRRDMLVMEMVNAQHAGVAFTERAYQDDLVNFTQGTGDQLVSGVVEGESISLPQLRFYESPTAEAPFLARLQRLLQGVRRAFSLEGHDWDIEWADDGERCWLLQVRPITQPPRRNEAFTYANLKEIMPDPPSRLMGSVVVAASTGFFDWYRQFDRTLPQNRPMVETFYGRPLFNLSLLTDMMRHWGLPSALVTSSIGGADPQPSGFHLLRFLSKSIPLLRLGWSQLNAVRYAKLRTAAVMQQAQQVDDTFGGTLAVFRDLFVTFVTEMFNLTQAMSGPLLLLRGAGTLVAHSATQQTIATELYTELAALRDIAGRNAAIRPILAEGRLPDDAEFRQAWQAFMAKHGHRGIYESDIARPRYQDQPDTLLAAIASEGRAQRPHAPAAATWRTRLTTPLWWQLSRVMRAREEWRYDSMRAYAIVRERLLALAEQAVARGQLPSIDALWLLDMAEAARLDEGERFSAEFFTARRQEIAEQAAIDVPDLVYRFDDLTAATVLDDADTVDALRGVSLTAGEVHGRAWVLREPAHQLPPGFDPHTTILVARSVDAGWIATFGQVAGAVIEIGGDLSHGSIILREIGLPAITNVRLATRHIATGDPLTLIAGRGVVRKTAPASA